MNSYEPRAYICKTKNHGGSTTRAIEKENLIFDGRYLLVFDAENASKMKALNLESLAIAPWLRHLTFRVPDANVVLVGNKWDLVASKHSVASEVERQSREWLASWIEKAHVRQPRGLSLEDGVSLVSCAPPVLAVLAPAFGGGTGWPCDKSKPGLFCRITHDAAGKTRALTMWLPPSYHLALELLEKLASCSRREDEQQTPGIRRASLEEKWQAKVGELKTAGTLVAAPEAAMSGAILIRTWEGGLVEYGNYIFLDVQWFATVLDPLFSHKRDSMGNIDLGGFRVTTNGSSLNRLDTEHVLEPKLAKELWGAELVPHLLLALKSSGLTFPFPKDPNGGLVILLRMDTERPPDYSEKLEEVDQTRKHDLELNVECSFSLGLPPGFVERLLARCCHLGFPHPFWRYGALLVGAGAEEGLFSLSLEYSEKEKILTVKARGGCKEVHAWTALSKALSVTIKMLSEFPGLPCEATFFCPVHKTKRMPISMTDARPGSRLVEESYLCPICQDREARKDLLAVALQVVKFSDEEFFDAQLRKQFAENAKNVARQERGSRPRSNSEVSGSAPSQINPSSQVEALFGDLEKAFTIVAGACFAAFGGLVSVSKPMFWVPFLVLGLLFSLAAAASVLRKWCCPEAQLGASTTGPTAGVHQCPMNGSASV